jgi:hypothetical protein
VPVGPNLNQKQMQLRKHYQTTLAVLDEPAAEDNPLALARRAENAVVRIQKTVSQLVSSRTRSSLIMRRGWRRRQWFTHRSRVAHRVTRAARAGHEAAISACFLPALRQV